MVHDFEYDILQKKRLARSAQHRKGKRGGQTCRMMTDHLTDKQWKELNGKVMSYNMNEPMTWAEFKSASIHIQAEYLQHLIANFKVNSSSLAQMFGVTPAAVRRHIEVNQMQIRFKVGNSMTAAEREAWERFLNRAEAQAAEPETKEESDCTVECFERVVQTPCETNTRMSGFSLSFEGEIDASRIANSILNIAGAGASGRIEIVCSLTDESMRLKK